MYCFDIFVIRKVARTETSWSSFEGIEVQDGQASGTVCSSEANTFWSRGAKAAAPPRPREVRWSFFLSFFLSFSVCFLFPPLCFSYFLFSIFYFILVFLSIFLYCYFLSTLIRPSCLHLSSCCSIVCHSLISLFISSKTLFFLTPFWISIFMPPSLTSPFPLIITFPHAWTLLSPYFYDILFISHPSYSSH